jgi:hypothetical protein
LAITLKLFLKPPPSLTEDINKGMRIVIPFGSAIFFPKAATTPTASSVATADENATTEYQLANTIPTLSTSDETENQLDNDELLLGPAAASASTKEVAASTFPSLHKETSLHDEVGGMEAEEELFFGEEDQQVVGQASSSQPIATPEEVEMIDRLNIDLSNVMHASCKADAAISAFSLVLVEDQQHVDCVRKYFNTLGGYLRKFGK